MSLPFLPLIGIDFGASAIKIAEVAGSRAKRKLVALGLELLPEGAIVDGVIKNPSAVEDALNNLLKRLKINPMGRRAAVAISPKAVEIKRLLLDSKAGEVQEVIYYEAEQHFQTQMNDLYFQYQKINSWSEDVRRTPVVMVGAKRTAVDQIIQIVKRCGLKIGVVDCESFCLANISERCYPINRTLTAIVDVGSQSSSVVLVYNGQTLYSKMIPVGGLDYTRRITEILGVESSNAESMKLAVSHGLASAPAPMQSVISDLNQVFVTELHSALKIYFDTTAALPGVSGLGAVLLTGGGSKMIGLEETIGTAFQIPVQMLNPFMNLQVNPKRFEIDYIMAQGHVFGVAAGLALRRMGDC